MGLEPGVRGSTATPQSHVSLAGRGGLKHNVYCKGGMRMTPPRERLNLRCPYVLDTASGGGYSEWFHPEVSMKMPVRGKKNVNLTKKARSSGGGKCLRGLER